MAAFGKSFGGGRRAGKRVTAPTLVLLEEQRKTYRSFLVDISTSGARVGGSDLPAVGAELMLNVDGLKTFGTVRWNEDEQCGVEFESQLSSFQVAKIKCDASRGAGLPLEVRDALDDWTLGLAR